MPPDTIVVSAKGKTLGRLASEVAVLLRGKNLVGYRPHRITGSKVYITDASEVNVTGNKDAKTYARHSGYIGNLRVKTLGDLLQTNPQWVIRHAVAGMLPQNRLKARILTRLSIS